MALPLPSNENKVFKVIIIGDANVGKTTLTYRFCEGEYLEYSEATIGVDFRTKTLTIDGEPVTLQLWDTAGQERYRMSMVKHYYRHAHAVILVYDVTDFKSFTNLRKWINESDNNCLNDLPRILVGNKCDGNRAIPTQTAQVFADQYNMPLFETSALQDSDVSTINGIFETLALKLKNSKMFLDDTERRKLRGTFVNDTATKSDSWCSC